MSKPTKKAMAETVPPGVVKTLAALARLAGVGSRQASNWKARPDFPVRPDGFYDVWAVAQWHALNVRAADDVEAGPPDSPALEKFRAERWKIAKLERQEREGILLRRDYVREVFSLVSSQLRRLGERIGLNAANAAVLLEDTLNEIERLGREWIEKNVPESTDE